MTDHIATLFRIEAGLLAFLLAFYALCARERKAPYITHTVYSEIGLVLFAVLATLVALTFTHCVPGRFFQRVADVTLIVAILATLRRVFSIANRDLRLRDDKWWLVIPGIFAHYLWKRRKRHESATNISYEHQPLSPGQDLMNAIASAGWRRHHDVAPVPASDDSTRGAEHPTTLCFVTRSYRAADALLLRLTSAFLDNGAYVQYTPCARHPAEFLLKLKSHGRSGNTQKDDKEWRAKAAQIVVVDAYTRHFGFYDSIHDEKTNFIRRQLGIHVVRCRPTFAGIHTATAEAFNWIKKGKRTRGMVLGNPRF